MFWKYFVTNQPEIRLGKKVDIFLEYLGSEIGSQLSFYKRTLFTTIARKTKISIFGACAKNEYLCFTSISLGLSKWVFEGHKKHTITKMKWQDALMLKSKCLILNQVCTTVACSYKSGPDIRGNLKNNLKTFYMDNVNGFQPKLMKL